MSISDVTGVQSQGTQNWHSTVRQARQDFNSIFQAMQSGDLATAQQAYSNLQGLRSNATAAGSTAGSSGTVTAASASPVATDWSNLGQALQAGNLSAAQTDFSQLQQDALTAWQNQMQQAIQRAATVNQLLGTQSTTSTSSATANGTSNPIQNDLSALSSALSSGDTSNAQALLAKLQQDLQASGQTHGHHHHHRADDSQAASQLAASSSVATTTGSSGSTTVAGSAGTATA